jgi:soluble cytochrome b562
VRDATRFAQPARELRRRPLSHSTPERRVDWKQQLLNKAVVLMQDPRVAKLMQDPRVTQGILGAMKLRADVQRGFEQCAQQVAKSLNLASEGEVQELRRAVARLEQELERARNQRRDTPDGRTLS